MKSTTEDTKKIPQDYDIFNDIPPFDIAKILPNKTTKELEKGGTSLASSYYKAHCGNFGSRNAVYNITTKKVQVYISKWVDVDEKTIYACQDGIYNTLYNKYLDPINKAKSTIEVFKKVKKEFHYLWKDTATQTDPDDFVFEQFPIPQKKLLESLQLTKESTQLLSDKPQEIEKISDEYLQKINASSNFNYPEEEVKEVDTLGNTTND